MKEKEIDGKISYEKISIRNIEIVLPEKKSLEVVNPEPVMNFVDAELDFLKGVCIETCDVSTERRLGSGAVRNDYYDVACSITHMMDLS